MKPTRFVLAAGFVVICGVALLGQTPATPAIAGFWLVQDTASGSWQEWWDNGPGVKAKVRPDIVKLNQEDDARVRAGNVVNTGGRGRGQQADDCGSGNLAMSFASSGGQEIAVSATARSPATTRSWRCTAMRLRRAIASSATATRCCSSVSRLSRRCRPRPWRPCRRGGGAGSRGRCRRPASIAARGAGGCGRPRASRAPWPAPPGCVRSA